MVQVLLTFVCEWSLTALLPASVDDRWRHYQRRTRAVGFYVEEIGNDLWKLLLITSLIGLTVLMAYLLTKVRRDRCHASGRSCGTPTPRGWGAREAARPLTGRLRDSTVRYLMFDWCCLSHHYIWLVTAREGLGTA